MSTATLMGMDVLSLIFPRKCIWCKRIGEYVCSNCFGSIAMQVDNICAVCSEYSITGKTHKECQGELYIDGISGAYVYKGVIKKLIHQYKNPPYLQDLTQTLGELFYESLIQNENVEKFLRLNPTIVSIPLSKQKLRDRGFNQSELLAKYLAKKLSLPYRKILSFEDGRIMVKKGLKDTPKSVLIVDDLLFTGKTVNNAAIALKKCGVKKVWGITLAQGK